MAHNPEIKENPKCKHTDILEYWHENTKCDLIECAVNECVGCGMFATECGMELED